LIQVLIGDALEKLREMPSQSVHCVVTSPPYWGLRDYSRCQCAQANAGEIYDSVGGVGGPATPRYSKQPKEDCPFCRGTGVIDGVKEHQLGLEKTPEEYVQKLVEVFREVKRVLRDDGTFWLNLGDCYAGSGKGQYSDGEDDPKKSKTRGMMLEKGVIPSGLKPKDLVGIPWRVAFALQADGWYLRSDIIWAKPNPMPESVTDRPTKSHEYIFLLTKSGEIQYWVHPEKAGVRTEPEPDYVWEHKKTHEIVREAPQEWLEWWGKSAPRGPNPTEWRRYNLWDGHDYFYDQEAIREENSPNLPWGAQSKSKLASERNDVDTIRATMSRDERIKAFSSSGRNKRSVWTMNTKPYTEAHFATFPPELPETCIKAGTSQKGCCPKCGAPWERIVEKKRPDDWEDSGPTTEKEKGIRAMSEGIYGGNQKSRSISDIFGRATKSKINTLGWQPTCECNETDTIPCTVLDPFAGSGTTGMVAKKLGRSAILVELNPIYIDMVGIRTGIGVREGPLDRFPDEEIISENLGDGT